MRSRRSVELVAVESIEWIDADGNYVQLHASGRKHRVRVAIGALEATLDPRQFLRIHRSTIVNVDRIARLELDRASDYTAVLHGGQRLTVGRTYRARLLPLLEGVI